MKINPIQNKNYVQNYRVNKTSTPKKDESGSYDKVTFSSEALNFSKVFSGLKDQINVSTAEERSRIDDVSARVRSGQYNVDSALVAESIMSRIMNG